MYKSNLGSFESKPKFYEALAREVDALCNDHWLTNFANFSALLMNEIEGLNWSGFYLLHHGELILGPFQGLPACTKIALSKGVCGAAATQKKTMVVEDVDAFPGHIACDSRSRSECVVPLLSSSGALLGVLDLDAPTVGRFDQDDARGLELVVSVLMKKSVSPNQLSFL